jgi:hypothetical protein
VVVVVEGTAMVVDVELVVVTMVVGGRVVTACEDTVSPVVAHPVTTNAAINALARRML